MTLTIVHTRDYRDYAAFAAALDRLRAAGVLHFDAILAANSHGLAAQYARQRNITLQVLAPDFARYRGRPQAAHRQGLLAATTQLLAFHDGQSRNVGELIARAQSRQLAVVVVVPVTLGVTATGEPRVHRPAAAPRTLW